MKEGEAVRILGTWFGNKVEIESPWMPNKLKLATPTLVLMSDMFCMLEYIPDSCSLSITHKLLFCIEIYVL